MNSRWWQIFCIQIETLETYRHHCRTHATYTPPCMSVNSNTPSTFFPTTHLPSWSILYHHRPVCHVRFAWKSDSMHVASFYWVRVSTQKPTRPCPFPHLVIAQRVSEVSEQLHKEVNTFELSRSVSLLDHRFRSKNLQFNRLQQITVWNWLGMIGSTDINLFQATSPS